MAGTLLETKLHMPRARAGLVDRARLVDMLDAGSGARLVLVSAPAGFGKTTLVADWLSRESMAEWATAWLSLGPTDDDPRTFLSYLVAALESVAPDAVAGAVALVSTPDGAAVDVLIELINGLQASSQPVLLVLDDVHVLHDPEIAEAIEFLVEHLPPTLRIVIVSRSDPTLPLARMRARGDLVEIRASDLRFNADEAAEYLETSMGLDLDGAQVATLERRTEGWIAALQLAALSLRGREDPAAFIETFAGDDRYVIDYLAGEVLDRQPSDVRDFLLSTSILGRLDVSLCAAVTGIADARSMLDDLERRNLFVVPLDDRRHAYRYHHLFGDVLRTRLLDERPADVAALHRRASEWFEQRGERAEAVQHALDSGDAELAAELIEPSLPSLRQARQDATLRRWLEALPSDVVEDRPVLGLGLVGALMTTGEFDRVDQLLTAIEQRLAAAAQGASRPLVVIDVDELDRVPVQIAMFRSALALVDGDVDAAATHGRTAFDLAAPDDHLGRGSSAALQGLAAWRRGDLDDAAQWYATSLASLEAAGHLSDVLGCSIAFSDIRVAQGRASQAEAILRRGLQLSESAGAPLRGAADMHVGLADLARERNDLAVALEHLESCDELGPSAGLPQNGYRRALVMARVRAAQGELGEAFRLLDDAEVLYDGDFSPDVRPISTVRARLWSAHRQSDRALAWALERGLSVDDEVTYLSETAHLALAAALVGEARAGREPESGSLSDVRRLLDRVLAAARDADRVASVVEVLVLRALCHDVAGEDASAADSLAEALLLSRAERRTRVVLDEGEPIRAVLRALVDDDQVGDVAADLLRSGQQGHDAAAPALGSALVDPLSDRELDVLRLLRSDLSGPEIASELIVSLNTVRSHTKSIYSKLQVTSRRAAVRRADELGL